MIITVLFILFSAQGGRTFKSGLLQLLTVCMLILSVPAQSPVWAWPGDTEFCMNSYRTCVSEVSGSSSVKVGEISLGSIIPSNVSTGEPLWEWLQPRLLQLDTWHQILVGMSSSYLFVLTVVIWHHCRA